MPQASIHNAPAVAYPLAAKGLEPLLLFGLWLAGALAVGLWLALASHGTSAIDSAAIATAAIGSVCLTGLVAAGRCRRIFLSRRSSPAAVWLVWDGHGWQHGGNAKPASTGGREHFQGAKPWADGLRDPAEASNGKAVFVVLDLQSVLLLCLKGPKPDHRKQWLWLCKRSQPGRWLDLRRAVFSRARQSAA